jgi:hypothetical protein
MARCTASEFCSATSTDERDTRPESVIVTTQCQLLGAYRAVVDTACAEVISIETLESTTDQGTIKAMVGRDIDAV